MTWITRVAYNPPSTQWLAVVVGGILLVMAVLAVVAAVRSKTRTLYPIIAAWFTCSGLLLIGMGVVLNMDKYRFNVATSPWAVAHDLTAHGYPPLPRTSLLLVGVAVLVMVSTMIFIGAAARCREPGLVAIGFLVLCVVAAVGGEICLYRWFDDFDALATTISLLAFVLALINVTRETTIAVMDARDARKLVTDPAA